MTDKTCRVAGVSALQGKYKMRFASENRLKQMQQQGHTDLVLFDLPQEMTKDLAARWVWDNKLSVLNEKHRQAVKIYIEHGGNTPKVPSGVPQRARQPEAQEQPKVGRKATTNKSAKKPEATPKAKKKQEVSPKPAKALADQPTMAEVPEFIQKAAEAA